MRDVGPVVDIRCGVECAGGVWNWDLGAVGLIVEGEELRSLFAVGGVDKMGLWPVDVVFVACFDVASDDAVGEVRVCGDGI